MVIQLESRGAFAETAVWPAISPTALHIRMRDGPVLLAQLGQRFSSTTQPRKKATLRLPRDRIYSLAGTSALRMPSWVRRTSAVHTALSIGGQVQALGLRFSVPVAAEVPVGT